MQVRHVAHYAPALPRRPITPRASMGDSYRSLRVRKRSNTSTLYDRTLGVEP